MKKLLAIRKSLSVLAALSIIGSAGALSASAAGTVVVLDNCDDAGLVMPGEDHFHGTENDYEDKKEGEACYKTSQDGNMVMACMWRNTPETDTKQTMETGAVQFWLYLPEYTPFANREHSVTFEITSSGMVDRDELEWDVEPYLTQDGWNLITLPFSDAARKNGEIDLTKICFYRIIANNIDDFEMKVDLIQFVDKADFAPTTTTTEAPPTTTTTEAPATTAGKSDKTTTAGKSDKTTTADKTQTASAGATATNGGETEEGGVNVLAIVLIVAGVLVLAGGGVAVFFILKKKDDGSKNGGDNA